MKTWTPVVTGEGSRTSSTEAERFDHPETAAVEGDFVKLWTEVRPTVLTFCARALGDYAAAEDVAQAVGVRAWRGFGSFRRDAPFNAWAMRIARNEVNRELHRRIMRIAREACGEVETEGIGPPNQECGRERDVDLRSLICEARDACAISEPEMSCLLLRITAPEKTWEQLAIALNAGASQCAANCCRAIPKLRVFVFLRYRDLFGTAISIRESMAEARISGAVTAREEQVFTRWVLDRRLDFRPAGWQTLLRSACAAVATRIAGSGIVSWCAPIGMLRSELIPVAGLKRV